MDVPVLLVRVLDCLLAGVDVGMPGWVGGVAAKAGFKRVAASVSQESRHTGSSESSVWWLVHD